MATFTFGRAVDIHWQGYEVVGPAGTVFSIPDQLYDEFNDDIAPVEPTLTWVDTNEFLTLSNSVSVTTLTGTIPISVTSTTSGKVVAISSTTNPAGYNLVADGTGGVIFQAASTGALTSVVGVSPMSTIIVGSTASVILNANYQTAGTYVTGVVGTSPISATGTTAITVTLNANYQTAGTYVNAVTGTSPASVSTASGTSTVSIVAASIDSTHLSATSVGSSQLIDGSVTSAKIAANAIVAAKIAANAVGVVKIDSGAATSNQVLTADGSGGASFTTFSAGVSLTASTVTATINNTVKQAILASAQTYTPSGIYPLGYDEFNDHIYAYQTTSTIRKINATTGSTIATITPSVTTSIIYDIAVSDHTSPYLCVITANLYFIIDGPSGTTIATGNIRPTGYTLNDGTTVRYDSLKSQFVINQDIVSAAVTYYFLRTIDASTQTTRYVILSNSVGYVDGSNATTARDLTHARTSMPIWHSPSSRWAIYQNWQTSSDTVGQFIFYSESTSTTSFLTFSGKVGVLAAAGSGSLGGGALEQSSDGSSFLIARARFSVGGTQQVFLVSSSLVSSAYSSTVLSISGNGTTSVEINTSANTYSGSINEKNSIYRSRTSSGTTEIFIAGPEAILTLTTGSTNLTKVLSQPFIIASSSVTESDTQFWSNIIKVGIDSSLQAKAILGYRNSVNDYRFVVVTKLADLGKIVTWAGTSPTTSFVLAEEPEYSGTSPGSETETFLSSFPIAVSTSTDSSSLVIIPAGGSWYSTIVGGVSTASTTVSRKVYRYG